MNKMIKRKIAYFMAAAVVLSYFILNGGYTSFADGNNDAGIDGNAVVALAESYVGKVPYVSGGNSLETGTDCSGFVTLIYKAFGIDIPGRSSQGILNNAESYGVYIGTDISQAKSGDLIFTGETANSGISHVGIYKDGGYIVHQTVPGSSVKVQSLSLRGMGYVKGIVRPYAIMNDTDGLTEITDNSYGQVVLTSRIPTSGEVEYKWNITGAENIETGWSANYSTYTFHFVKTGVYNSELLVRQKGDESGNVLAKSTTSFYHKNAIKGICQMPYTGEGGGYLIGIESYDNPNQSYRYEMLILDCTLYSQGLPAWIYSTGQCGAPETCLWTIWQPKYGYYWTLFRIYDSQNNLIAEECFGFQNI